MTTNSSNLPSGIFYPVHTVIVFLGAPSSDALTEAYRVHFQTEADARRFARRTTTAARTNWQTGGTFVPPCASIFEDSPSRGLGKHVAEYTSRARARYLARVAATSNQAARS